MPNGEPGNPGHPALGSGRVLLRPGRAADVEVLRAIQAEPAVAAWWGHQEPADEVAGKLLRRDGFPVLLVIEAGGEAAGGIEYSEETNPMYRHAGIDIYLGSAHQGQGIGPEAVGLLAEYLFAQRGHHRLTIDPAAANRRAIRCYEKVGFRPVGLMREYERGTDGRFHDGLLMDMLRGELTRPG